LTSETPNTAIREAAREGNIEEVVGIIQEFQTQSVSQLLDSLEVAIKEEDYEEARIVLGQIQQTFQENRSSEVVAVAQAEVVRATGDIPIDQHQILAEYINGVASMDLRRAQLLAIAEVLLSNPAEQDDGQVQTTIGDTRQAEDQLQQTADQVEPVISESELQPKIAIPSFVPPQSGTAVDQSFTSTLSVENVGDSEAKGVEVTVAAPDSVELSTETFGIGSISAHNTVTKEIEGVGSQEGAYTLNVRVASENAGNARESATIAVRTEQEQPPPIGDFTNPPTDQDDDGLYEDITGDGTLGFNDVVELFQHRNDPTVQSNQEAFDFNGNGQFDFDDIVKLYEKVQESE
jgi:hypothetical protein